MLFTVRTCLSLCALLFTLLLRKHVNALQAPIAVIEAVRPSNNARDLLQSMFAPSYSYSSWIGASASSSSSVQLSFDDATTTTTTVGSTQLPPGFAKTWKKDKVVRVVDANTVKLEKQGLITLAGVQMPSVSANFQFPECFDKAPSYKLRKLLPAGTAVHVQMTSTSSSSSTSTSAGSAALVVVDADGTLINAALIEAGFGRLKEKSAKQAESFVPNFVANLSSLQQRAQTSHVGMYQSCTAGSDSSESATANVVTATFEPLQPEEPVEVPPNPGDRRNCADFETYEDALRYYETFLPYYGDVARLDRDNDGVPCPGLAHTTNPDLYRMKVPKDRQGMTKPGQ